MSEVALQTGLSRFRQTETDQEKQTRLAWEIEALRSAQASADAGLLIPSEEIDAWIDSLGTDHELPPPRTGL